MSENRVVEDFEDDVLSRELPVLPVSVRTCRMKNAEGDVRAAGRAPRAEPAVFQKRLAEVEAAGAVPSYHTIRYPSRGTPEWERN